MDRYERKGRWRLKTGRDLAKLFRRSDKVAKICRFSDEREIRKGYRKIEVQRKPQKELRSLTIEIAAGCESRPEKNGKTLAGDCQIYRRSVVQNLSGIASTRAKPSRVDRWK